MSPRTKRAISSDVLYSSGDDIQTVAIIAAIVREVSGGYTIDDAISVARDYLAAAKAAMGKPNA